MRPAAARAALGQAVCHDWRITSSSPCPSGSRHIHDQLRPSDPNLSSVSDPSHLFEAKHAIAMNKQHRKLGRPGDVRPATCRAVVDFASLQADATFYKETAVLARPWPAQQAIPNLSGSGSILGCDGRFEKTTCKLFRRMQGSCGAYSPPSEIVQPYLSLCHHGIRRTMFSPRPCHLTATCLRALRTSFLRTSAISLRCSQQRRRRLRQFASRSDLLQRDSSAR